MGKEVVGAKEGLSRAVDQLKKIRPETADITEDHERAVAQGDQFIANLAATMQSLTGYLDALESIGRKCDTQQQGGAVACNMLREAGIVKDDKSPDTIRNAVSNVDCVGLYAERYKETIQPVVNALGTAGVLGVLQELHAKSEVHIEAFATEAPDEVSEVVDWAIDDCTIAIDSI